MNSRKKILVAFILNLFFSVFELIGGIFTGSVAILSDSLHDMGDAVSIGISFFLEKISNRKPDEKYTYGYRRYSVLGSVITTLVLITGSVIIVCSAAKRIISPTPINHNSMIIFAVVGVVVNTLAAVITHGKESLNQRAVNLHMLEDVLGWIVVLIGAFIVKFTGFTLIDPILSIAVALFILVNAIINLKDSLHVFLECSPSQLSAKEIKSHILEIQGITDVHHLHLWSIDGITNFATMHIVAQEGFADIKESVRRELSKHNISHITIETETADESCKHRHCNLSYATAACSHSHHHHHH